ncbi:type VII secretion protein EccB [Amycolatopsis taiwanensis]|uniref:Type VII secretion protein EccB n=1 Tax=Amycolatopsis taiwanensis TaxID=342230 RepID=A0A9W6QXJ3_9PSEU|nr:type VII secretion protein EccB [Amycolatopsis taiwanensis]GLY64725.1 hypothetical protein Atai01_13440 [Amycolatopsis taiwanensis]
MLTRRDQVQSYQFLIQRVTSALTMRETDPLTPPFRRFVITGFGSIVVACIVMAVAGIYGLLNPGGNESWRTGDQVILERETGALYVFRDSRLYRAANYASALLLLGKNAGTIDVSRNSLLGVPRGPEVGIAGAPNGLPQPENLLHGPWSLCSRRVTDTNGAHLASTVLIVGDTAPGRSLAGEEGFLADNIETGDEYLVVNGYRHKITDSRAAKVGLALNQEPLVQVGSAWLDALPAGVDLAPMPIPGRGGPSAFPGALVGQVMVVRTVGGPPQYYVALAEGLRPVSEVESALLFASQDTAAAYPGGMPAGPREIDPAQAAAMTLPAAPESGPEQLPRTRPRMSGLAAPDAVVCGSFQGVQSPAPATIALGAALPVSDSDLVTARRTRAGTSLADRILIAPGSGALVESMQGTEGPGTVQLITEQGVRYPLASRDVVGMLGYSPSDVVSLPAALVARVPEGAALDPAAAGTVLLQN